MLKIINPSVTDLVPISTALTCGVELIVIAHPFSVQREILVVPGDRTVQDILDGCGYSIFLQEYFHVCVDGYPILRMIWSEYLVRDGATMTVRAVPKGGRTGKVILRALIVLVIVALAAYYAPVVFSTGLAGSGGFAAFASAAVAGIAATLAVNALIPLPTEAFKSGASSSEETLAYSVTGSQNRANPYGVLPRVYGTHRMYPPLGAVPYTEVIGNDQYLIMIFVLNVGGPITISEQKIGDTDITEFTDITTHFRPGYVYDPGFTIYTHDVEEEALSVNLLSATPVVRTTPPAVTRIVVEVTFPRGLIRVDGEGKKWYQTVNHLVEYSVKDANSWVTAGTISTSRKTAQLIRDQLDWTVTSGDYDVRLTRQEANGDNVSRFNDASWTMLRVFRPDEPINRTNVPRLSTMEMRIKGTDQLNGIIDSYNCVVQSLLPYYNGTTWPTVYEPLSDTTDWEYQATNNPAWAYAYEMIGHHNRGIVGVSRLDAAVLKTWADNCDTAGREYNAVHEDTRSILERLQTIASTGRATPSLPDGLWGVVEDKVQTTPRQIFTPRNSRNFSGQKIFLDLPHALKMQFINAAQGWQQDERLVYADGYSSANATKFESIPMRGITSADQVWKEGRFHLAVATLRPETWEIDTDIEHLVVTKGDLVLLNHDVMLVGLGAGRVISVTLDGTDVIAISTDETFLLEADKDYLIQIRFPDGTITSHSIVSSDSETKSFTFTTPIPDTTDQPAVGDFFCFGISGKECIRAIVKSIIPNTNESAKLTLLDEAPGVHTADTGTIPPYDSQITKPSSRALDYPPAPAFGVIRSDEFVGVRQPNGDFVSRIAIELIIPSGFDRSDVIVQVMYRELNTDGPFLCMPAQEITVPEAYVFPVEDGVEYELTMRLVRGLSIASPFSSTVVHKVQGKITPPPEVDWVTVDRMPDGTRVFAWELLKAPPDLWGVMFKYKLGTDGTWSDSTFLHDEHTPIVVSPWETNQLAAGQYTFIARTIDTSGNLSPAGKFIISTIGDPRLGGALIQVNCRALGYPGTKTDCFVDGDGRLLADDSKTWADFDLEGLQWSDWDTWTVSPFDPITYEHSVIDLGAIVEFTPLVTVTGSGTPTITEAHSDDDITYTSFAAITGRIQARYFKIKVVVSDPAGHALIENCIIIADAQALVEDQSDVDTSTLSGSTGDRRIALVKTFSVITSVTIALQNVGAGYSTEIIDKSVVSGPNFKIYDNTNTLADVSSVDFVIRGIA
jgi:hypothetical protein